MFTRLPTERSLDQDIEERRQRYTQQLDAMTDCLGQPKDSLMLRSITLLLPQEFWDAITHDPETHAATNRIRTQRAYQAIGYASQWACNGPTYQGKCDITGDKDGNLLAIYRGQEPVTHTFTMAGIRNPEDGTYTFHS